MIHFTDLDIFGGNELYRDDTLPTRNMTRVFIFDDQGRIGLVENKWPPHNFYLPGGGCEGDESFEQCAVRECLEEIGTQIDINRITEVAVCDRWDSGHGTHFHIVFLVAHATEVGAPTSTDPREQNRAIRWIPVSECRELMQQYIVDSEDGDHRREPLGTLYVMDRVLLNIV